MSTIALIERLTEVAAIYKHHATGPILIHATTELTTLGAHVKALVDQAIIQEEKLKKAEIEIKRLEAIITKHGGWGFTPYGVKNLD